MIGRRDIMANQDIGVQHTLKDLRVRLNLSQELAAKGSVSVPTLRSWENDSSNLTLAQMKRLADFYKIPLEYIFLEVITLLAID